MPKSHRNFPGFARSAAYAGAVLGLCGCGSSSDFVIGSDVEDGAAALCVTGDQTPAASSLVHRYSFSGTGTTISDSVGGADGQSAVTAGTPAQLDGSGVLTLDGVTDYVDLPSGIISSLGNATIMAWTAWRGGPAYQRVFDFGTSTLGAGQREQCQSCLLLMDYSGDARGNGLCAQVHVPNVDVQQIVTSQLLDKTFRQVALAFESGSQMTLYLDGAPIGSTPITVALSDIVDDNDWLGLSQYATDTNYEGAYDEVRIYDHALSSCEVKATFDAGPDAL
jgi:hypothetical protein